MSPYSGQLGFAQNAGVPAFDKVARDVAAASNTGNIESDVPRCADAALASLKADYPEQYKAWIAAGSTDADIIQAFASECERLYRAGEVPPKKKTNWLLWGGLGALAVAGVIVVASKTKENPAYGLSNPIPSGRRRLTKAQVVRMWREDVKPGIVARYGSKDRAALAESWNEYTDMLCKEGLITQSQYETWSAPNDAR